jgi:hypothetical protein
MVDCGSTVCQAALKIPAAALLPRVSAEFPEGGERFAGLVPPVVAALCFAIRRPAVAVFTSDDYVGSGIMSAPQAELVRIAVLVRRQADMALRHEPPEGEDFYISKADAFACAVYRRRGAHASAWVTYTVGRRTTHLRVGFSGGKWNRPVARWHCEHHRC